MRTWLYRIATNTCLNAQDAARRRALPMQLWPASDPADAVAERTDVPWLEPLPTARAGVGPEDAAVARESLRLPFVAMLQTLPPCQRAVLLLRDVLCFSAAETAQMLGTTTTAVNSGLRRARDQVAAGAATHSEPAEPELRRRLDQYVATWEAKDVPAIVALFTSDAFATYTREPDGALRPLSCRCSTSARTGSSMCTRSSTRRSSRCSTSSNGPARSRTTGLDGGVVGGLSGR
jgi:RNA polymerase sigma-70 factor (ECF subfamily)